MIFSEACNESVSKVKMVFSENDIHLRKNGSLKVEPATVKFQKEITYALFETDIDKMEDEEVIDENITEIAATDDLKAQPKYKNEFVWRNIVIMIGLHLACLYGFCMIPYAKMGTLFWTYLLLQLGTLGVQAGVHRLWAHKTYKANFGLRLFLSLCFVLALQNDIYEWSRDHRAHHKFSDTDGDPHNSSRGFFFSHVGWLLVKKHPDVKRRGATLDMSDLLQDPIVVFQKKYYIPMVAIFWGVIPAFVPVLFWGEDLIISVTICVIARYVFSLNLSWFVNSWAHTYGYRTYNQKLAAVEASIRHMLMGEGFHNYHHAFPWDYSASELGAFDVFNPGTAFIDFFHWMGWAWDLKKVNPALIDSRKKKTGDPAIYHKRNTAFYEWTTGMATILLPLFMMLYANTRLF